MKNTPLDTHAMQVYPDLLSGLDGLNASAGNVTAEPAVTDDQNLPPTATQPETQAEPRDQLNRFLARTALNAAGIADGIAVKTEGHTQPTHILVHSSATEVSDWATKKADDLITARTYKELGSDLKTKAQSVLSEHPEIGVFAATTKEKVVDGSQKLYEATKSRAIPAAQKASGAIAAKLTRKNAEEQPAADTAAEETEAPESSQQTAAKAPTTEAPTAETQADTSSEETTEQADTPQQTETDKTDDTDDSTEQEQPADDQERDAEQTQEDGLAAIGLGGDEEADTANKDSKEADKQEKSQSKISRIKKLGRSLLKSMSMADDSRFKIANADILPGTLLAGSRPNQHRLPETAYKGADWVDASPKPVELGVPSHMKAEKAETKSDETSSHDKSKIVAAIQGLLDKEVLKKKAKAVKSSAKPKLAAFKQTAHDKNWI